MFQPENNPNFIYALFGIISTLIGIIAFIMKNELNRLRDSIHELRNTLFTTFLALTIIDEKIKNKLKEEMKQTKS